jgi:hypothetical protein
LSCGLATYRPRVPRALDQHASVARGACAELEALEDLRHPAAIQLWRWDAVKEEWDVSDVTESLKPFAKNGTHMNVSPAGDVTHR